MNENRFLLLSGSYRGNKTTSGSILDYTANKLEAGGAIVKKHRLSSGMSDNAAIIDDFSDCGALLLCFPLYFDSLPSPLVAFFEDLLSHKAILTGKNFYVIVHCGLPESNHCKNALEVCELFAGNAGINLLGAAIIPDTGAIDGAGISSKKRVTHVLDKMADLMKGRGSKNSVRIFTAKPSMSPAVFRFFGNIAMKLFARSKKSDIFQKPYSCGF